MYIPKMIDYSNHNGVFKIEKGEENTIIGYEQNYVPSKDITILTKAIYSEDDIILEEIIGFYHGSPNASYSLEGLYDSQPLIAEYEYTSKKGKELTNYDKLVWAEANKADKVRILVRDEYNKLYYGYANTSGDDVFIDFEGYEDEVVTIEEFNRDFKIIRIIF